MELNNDSSSLISSTTTVSSSNVTPVPPSTAFINLFLKEINTQDIHGLLDVQRSLLEQLDKTNEKLDGINKISARRYLDASRDFSSHTRTLTNMKNDLDLIFKRINLLKLRLSKKYPEAYTSTLRQLPKSNDDLDEEDDNFGETISLPRTTTNSLLVKSNTIDCVQFSTSNSDNQQSS